MSMPLHNSARRVYDAFFSGDEDLVSAHAAQWDDTLGPNQAVFLSGPMLGSDATADHFCSAYPIGQAMLATLQAAHNGSLNADDPHLAGFLSLKLLDAEGHLTERGRWKMISELPSAACQAALLGIPYADVDPPSDRDPRPEGRVASMWKQQGFEAIHDEGGTIHRLITCALAKHAKAVKKLVPPDRFGLPPNDRHFLEMLGVSSFFIRNDLGLFSADKGTRAQLGEIFRGTTAARLRSGWSAMLEEHSSNWSKPMAGRIEQVLGLFQALGAARLAILADWLLADPAMSGGWPDVTAFRGNEIVLIEVKRRDRLMFHQVRSIDLIKNRLAPAVVAAVRLERVVN